MNPCLYYNHMQCLATVVTFKGNTETYFICRLPLTLVFFLLSPVGNSPKSTSNKKWLQDNLYFFKGVSEPIHLICSDRYNLICLTQVGLFYKEGKRI